MDEDLTFTIRRDARPQTSFLFYVDSRSALVTCQTLTVDTAWGKTAILYLLTPISVAYLSCRFANLNLLFF